MAPATKKVEKSAAKPATDVKKTEKKLVKKGKPRNYDLGNGVYRFSRSRMFHKKALYKFVGKKTPPTPKVKKPKFVVKPIGGDKNGKERQVLLKKRRNFYPTQDKIKKHPAKKLFRQHKRTLRSSLQPGTLLILLAGAHKGKRVVLLKQLKSGLLLITGPYGMNGCPLRRIHQRYVIGTQTRINLDDVKLPEQLNDEYFRRHREKRAKKEEGDIFQTKKETYKCSDQRKADQKDVDKQIMGAIRKHPDSKVLLAYLSAMFGLRSSQYPHILVF